MNSVKLNLGKGSNILKKSSQLIGVKFKPNARTFPSELEGKKLVNKRLAGFKIYKVAGNIKDVNSILDKIRKHKSVLLGTHVYFTPSSRKPIVPNGSLFISFNSNSNKKEQAKILKNLNLKVERYIDDFQVIAEVTDKSPNPIKACVFLKAAEIVADAIPDFAIPIDHYEFKMPANSLFPLQWHLQNNGAARGEPKGKIIKGADIRVIDAWKRLGNKGSNKVRIAIVDSGFQLDHPAYKDKIVKQFSLFVDAFAHTQSGHGTACAGLAVASDTGNGIIGVAPNAELVLIDGSSNDARSMERVFKFCMDNDVDIISCSWGEQDIPNGFSPMHHAVYKEVTTKGRNGKGCILLFAAGNENSEHVNVLATHPNVICVAGSTSADEHFYLSNRGKEVSIAAPAGGWPLIAPCAYWTVPHWEDEKIRGEYGEYEHFTGTSASTPLVAGVCALILSANPDLSSNEVKDILQNTADKIGSENEYENGHSLRFGHGRVNADKAVREAMRLRDPSSVLPDLQVGSGSGLYQFNVKPLAPKGYGVQTGALREYGNVLKMVDKLQNLFNSKVMVNINELNGEPNYKIILGPFDKKSSANTLKKKVDKKGLDCFVVNLSKFK